VSDPHSTMRFDHGQTGDVHSRDVAGRDVQHIGFSAADVQMLLARQAEFQTQMLSLVSDLATQLNRDASDRQRRQELADRKDERLNARLWRIEFGLVALTVALMIGMGLLLWLFADRYLVESAARVVAGTAAALMLWKALH
jgi:hypothetical protein